MEEECKYFRETCWHAGIIEDNKLVHVKIQPYASSVSRGNSLFRIWKHQYFSSYTGCQLSTYRMKFRILLQYFRVRHDKAPDYICKFICFKISTKYELKSDQKLLLLVPNCKMFPTLRTRVFSFATPYLWNSLPSNISGLDTISIFQRNLKTYLFRWTLRLLP